MQCLDDNHLQQYMLGVVADLTSKSLVSCLLTTQHLLLNTMVTAAAVAVRAAAHHCVLSRLRPCVPQPRHPPCPCASRLPHSNTAGAQLVRGAGTHLELALRGVLAAEQFKRSCGTRVSSWQAQHIPRQAEPRGCIPGEHLLSPSNHEAVMHCVALPALKIGSVTTHATQTWQE